MPVVSISPQPKLQFFDANGNPLSGGKLYTYAAGTTTPLASYTDSTGNVANTNPVVLDSRGEASVWLAASQYKLALYTATNVLVWTVDGLNGPDRATLAALAAPGGSALVGFIQAGAGAVTRTAQAKMRDIVDARDYGAVVDNATNNTSSVQSALNALPAYGGTVYIPDGAKFNLRNLTFPARFNLNYRSDDDLSQAQLPSFTLASSERVLFSSNSSYPADPTGGAVNEYRVTAPFHPAVIVDVRKDLGANIASYLGPGQSINNPVRASYNIGDEQNVVFRIAYENYLTPSTFSGLFVHGYRTTVRLNGIGTAQWTSVPAAGVLVTGTTSGAKGFVLTVAAGYTDLFWFSGDFVTGETVSDNNETTTATITSVVYSEVVNSWIAQDLKTGAWTIGDRPPGIGSETLNVSGNTKVVPTRGGSINVPKSVTDPVYAWGDDPEGASPNQIGLMYPTTGNAAFRRLQAVRQDLATSTGAIVPVSVMTNIDSFLVPDTNSVNVASITKPLTGKYLITFTNNLARVYPVYTLALDGFYMQNWWAGVTLQAVGSCEVWVKDDTGAFADIPVGARLGLVGLGGDI
jgi:hypothetical protein